MGKASISIAISGSYNGSAVERAQKSIEKLAVKTAAAEGSISQSWVKAGAAAAEAGGKVYNAGQRIAQTGDSLTQSVTVPLVGVGAAATKTAIDFESSMSRVSGALNDPKSNIEELRQLALDMGADTVFSASEAGAAMEELAKGGLTSADIQGGALKTTMDLAAAGSLELAEAANVVVQSMGAFGLSAEDTGEAANALAGAAAASSADVSDLTSGLSQASAQAHSAGWSIQDTTAVLAAFADAGIKGSDAGTSLKTMLQRLAAPMGKASSMLEELGIQTRDSNGNMLDAAAIAGQLQGKLAGLDSATRDAAIQTIFGADASRAALVMMNQGTKGIQAYTAATSDQEAAQRLANSQMGNSQRTLEEMAGAIETAAIQVGTAIAPAVTSFAEGISKAAEAFSELDEGQQSAILGFAGFAAAAGPVLSVTGRLTKAAGSAVVAYGRIKQSVSTYADALTTSNAVSLKAYSQNKKLASSLAKNPFVKAAGGVDKYMAAVEAANAAQSKYNKSVKAYESALKHADTVGQDVINTRRAEMEQAKQSLATTKQTVTALNNSATASKASTAAIKAQAVAMKAATVASGALKAALGIMVPMIAITAITTIASALSESSAKAKEFEGATEGLTTATKQTAVALDAGSSSLEGYSSSASTAKISVDEVVQSQSQLAKNIQETNLNTSAQIGQLNNAWSTIQQYANQTDLSTDAQNRLKTAVETVNSLCGTQIEVTNAANGELSNQDGVITDLNEAIGENIEQTKRKIKIDAQQQTLSDLYKQQAEDLAALGQAQKAYNDKWGDLTGMVENYMRVNTDATEAEALAWAKRQAAQSEEAQALEKTKGLLDSTNESINTVEGSLGAMGEAATSSTSSLQTLAQASPIVSTYLQNAGLSLDDFVADLESTGISVEDFASLNDTQLGQLVTGWDGTADSLYNILQGMKVDVGSLPGSFSSSTNSAVNAAQTALINGQSSLSGAAGGLVTAAVSVLNTMPTQAKTAGANTSAGMASGMNSKLSSVSSAVSNAKSKIQELDNMDSKTWGKHLAENFAKGLRSKIDTIASAAAKAMAAASSFMGFSVPEEGVFAGAEKGGETSGRHLAENFARGLRSGSDLVAASADSLTSGISLTGSTQSQNNDTLLLSDLVLEVKKLREDLGSIIAENAPRFPSERDLRRIQDDNA